MTFLNKKISIGASDSARNARSNQMRRSTPNNPYTPSQQPTATIIPSSVSPSRRRIYRDEIFYVTVTVSGTSQPYDGTMKLELSQGTEEQTLGSRGKVQMYDFANLEANPDCDDDTSITSLTFAPTDNGAKTFRAVVNVAPQTIKIKATHMRTTKHNFDLSVETPEIEVVPRLRQYTTKHTNDPANNYDQNINRWVAYWDDWKIGKNGAQEPFYTFMTGAIPDGDLVKAVAYKESTMKTVPNLMQLTTDPLYGMRTGHQDVERDPHAGAIPPGYNPETDDGLGLTAIPFMNYGTPTRATVDESLKWGIRWLIAKRTEQLDAEGGGYKIRIVDWWVPDGAISRYGDPTDATYVEDVQKLYVEGRNPHTNKTTGKRDPYYLWPIKADGCPRQDNNANTGETSEETPENPPAE